MSPPPTPALSCNQCGKSFGSSAHLKRHHLVHTQARTYACDICRKSFVRGDALTRHVRTHDAVIPRLQARGFRACLNCAEAKAKCSAETPACARCRKRNVRCLYPSAVQNVHHPDHDDQIARGTHQEAMQTHFLDDIWASLESTTNWLGDLGNEFSPNVRLDVNEVVMPEEQQHDLLPEPYVDNAQDILDTPYSADSQRSSRTHITGSLSAGSARTKSEKSHGSRYVDGEAGRRAPKRRRRHLSEQYDDNHSTSLLTAGNLLLSDNTMDHVIAHFDILCLQACPIWPSMQATVPPKKELQTLLNLYFEEFETLPFLHNTFDVNQTDLCLLLAILAIGSFYADAPGVKERKEFWQELTRRCLLRDSLENRARPQAYWQARLLHFVGVTFGSAATSPHELTTQRSVLLEVFSYATSSIEHQLFSEDDEYAWRKWVQEESLRRLLYSVFFVDRVTAFNDGVAPMIDLSLLTTPLPCSENLWLAGSASEWQVQAGSESSSLGISLQTALEHLYVEKRLQRSHGQFSQILIVLGIMSRQDQVSRYYENPLSSWSPKAGKDATQNVFPPEPIWLPSIPGFRAWENSFCDALDVVHWLCNASTGEASGIEPPLAGVLHGARVLMLTPLQEILTFSEKGAGAATAAIERWATRHQYKARLAMVHCGVTLWHYRRYSTSAFHEPSFVAYAALCLWAYSLFAPRQDSTPPSVSEDSDDACDLILIDRPADDEIVQQFIRKGSTMHIHMTNVGDLLRDEGAPRKILLQGLKILRGLGGWDAARWVARLERLVETYRPA